MASRVSDTERELKAAARLARSRLDAAGEAATKRDELIRALAPSLTRSRMAELTGLSVERIYQILRGTR